MRIIFYRVYSRVACERRRISGRALNAIKVCKECLIFVNNEVQKNEEQFVSFVKIAIYETIFRAYCLIPDFPNAIKYGRELVDVHRECGETAKEGNLTLTLAYIFDQQ